MHSLRQLEKGEGKGDKCECCNSRGMSLLSVVGKLCGRVMIKRVRAGTECAIGEGTMWVWAGQKMHDQVYAVR